MDVELREIRDFLAAHAPFDALPDEALDELPAQMFMHYYRRGSVIVDLGGANNSLFVLRSGAIDVYKGGVELIERADPGTCVGTTSLMERRPSRYRIIAIEDSLVLVLPGAVLYQLLAAHDGFADFFDAAGVSHLRRAAANLQADPTGRIVLNTRVRDVIVREPITADPTLSVREAAQLMTDHRVSALLVMEGQKLVGILTDRDLRTTVVAAGLDLNTTIHEVMTPTPVTIDSSTLVLEAILEMVGRTVHHLPVVDDGRLIGLVSQGDLLRLETANPVFLVGDIAKQTTPDGVAKVAASLPLLMRRLLGSDADAHGIQRLATGVADAAARRLLYLAEFELGNPPVPYAWLALGSQARREHGPASDQDHLLLLDDSATPEHDEYFAALAEFVTGGLERCGYRRCSGDAMATNPRWRQTLKSWRGDFHHWISEPEPEAVLRAQIFFDARIIAGEDALAESLRQAILDQTPQAARFLGHLATHATDHPVPIGFFRGFVLERAGEHRATVDLKAGGVAPIVEIARVYALAHGVSAVNTLDRLRAVADDGHLSTASMEGLIDAWDFISYLRLRHQVDQATRGLTPDNHIAPDTLSAREKKHLREAFGIVRQQQQALGFTYQTQLMS